VTRSWSQPRWVWAVADELQMGMSQLRKWHGI